MPRTPTAASSGSDEECLRWRPNTPTRLARGGGMAFAELLAQGSLQVGILTAAAETQRPPARDELHGVVKRQDDGSRDGGAA